MANSISFIIESKVLKTFALDAGEDITGVCIDGPYLWVTKSPGTVEQHYLTNEGTLTKVSELDLTGFGYNSIHGITRDDTDLYVSVLLSDEDPPITGIIKISKQGHALKTILQKSASVSDANGYIDLEFDGLYLWALFDDGISSGNLPVVEQIDIMAGVIVQSFAPSVSDPIVALTFNGVNLQLMSSADFFHVDRDGNILALESTTGIVPSGLAFANPDLNLQAGFLDSFDGILYVVAHI